MRRFVQNKAWFSDGASSYHDMSTMLYALLKMPVVSSKQVNNAKGISAEGLLVRKANGSKIYLKIYFWSTSHPTSVTAHLLRVQVILSLYWQICSGALWGMWHIQWRQLRVTIDLSTSEKQTPNSNLQPWAFKSKVFNGLPFAAKSLPWLKKTKTASY